MFETTKQASKLLGSYRIYIMGRWKIDAPQSPFKLLVFHAVLAINVSSSLHHSSLAGSG